MRSRIVLDRALKVVSLANSSSAPLLRRAARIQLNNIQANSIELSLWEVIERAVGICCRLDFNDNYRKSSPEMAMIFLGRQWRRRLLSFNHFLTCALMTIRHRNIYMCVDIGNVKPPGVCTNFTRRGNATARRMHRWYCSPSWAGNCSAIYRPQLMIDHLVVRYRTNNSIWRYHIDFSFITAWRQE